MKMIILAFKDQYNHGALDCYNYSRSRGSYALLTTLRLQVTNFLCSELTFPYSLVPPVIFVTSAADLLTIGTNLVTIII